MDPNELTGLIAAFLAAACFGSYGVPMKGEAATRVDVDPFVFQSYKAFTVFATSSILIYLNNQLADDNDVVTTSMGDSGTDSIFHKWTFSDFTPWAFISALLWVPGGTAGVYAIRRSGLAVSVGIWSCVIVILSFIWGVLIFGERQKSKVGAIGAVTVLCIGLCGIAYFSSAEVIEGKKKGHATKKQQHEGGHSIVGENTPLVEKGESSIDIDSLLDFETYPHSGIPPHAHQTVDLHVRSFSSDNSNANGRTFHIEKYHIGLCMAVVNGVLAATIMVPLHYAPPNTTRGIGYSMSFGIAAVLVVLLFWLLRFLARSTEIFICHPGWRELASSERGGLIAIAMVLHACLHIVIESLGDGYRQMPSFHIREMWRSGLLSGILYSMGNIFGIVGIQKLGNFMGYSLNQSSIIISGLWGIFYYREIPGAMNMIGFLLSTCIVFAGILLMASEHV